MASAKSKMRNMIRELEDFDRSQSHYIKQLSKYEGVLAELIKRLKKETTENKDSYSIIGSVGKYLGFKHDSNSESELQNEIIVLRRDNENLLTEFEKYKLESEQMKKTNDKEKNDLLNRLNKRNRANEELLDLIGEHKEKLVKAEEEIESNKTSLENMKERNDILTPHEEEMENLKKENSKLGEMYNTVQLEKDELKEKIINAEEELKSNETSLKNMKERNDILATLEEETENLKKENCKLSEIYNTVQLDNGRLLKDFAVQNQELVALKTDFEKKQELFETEKDKLKESLKQMDNDMKHLKAVHDTVILQKDELIRQNKDICDKHAGEKEKFEKEIQTLQNINTELRNQLDSNKQEMLKVTEQHEKELVKYKHDREQSAQKYCKLEQDFNDVTCLRQTLDAKLQTRLDEMEKLVKIKVNLEIELSRARSKIEDMLEKNQTLENQIQNKGEELSQLQADNRNLQDELLCLQSKEQDYLTEESRLKDELKNVYSLKAELEVSENTVKNKLSRLEESSHRMQEQMTQKIDKLGKETRLKDQEIFSLNAQNASLQTKVRDFDEKEEKYLKEEKELKSSLLERKKEVTELTESISSLRTRISDMDERFTKTKEELTKQVVLLEKKLDTKEKKISEANESIITLQEKEQKLVIEIGSLKAELSESKDSVLKLKESNNSIQTKLTHMEEKSIQMNELNDTLSAQNTSNIKKLDTTSNNLNKLSEEKDQLEEKMSAVQSKTEDLEKENGILLSKLELAENERKDLANQLEKLMMKPRKHIELSVFSSMKPGLTDIAMKDLSKHLKKEFEKEDTDLIIRPVVDPSAIERPAVVLCISISRLGADVQEALRGIRASSDVAVIIFHHKEVHALPSQSSEKILTGSDYKKLGSIIDMAVFSNKGIYNCDMNDFGFKKLITFLTRFSVSKK